MGWPDQTKELKVYYPTSLLVTAFDILTFWVSRMLMMGVKFMGDVPFHEVYIHALVRDIEGRKMSKSLGNVMDPLEVIDQYGADAFRFALAAFAAQGREIKLSTERIEGYRNFMNKLWNAARFVLMNLDEDPPPRMTPQDGALSVADRWIWSRLSRTIHTVRDSLEHYRFNEAAGAIYQFLWHEYCDWYLEWIKPELYKPDSPAARERVQSVSLTVLSQVLQLIHPFSPFVTEEIWQTIPGSERSIMVSSFPQYDATFLDDAVEEEIELIKAVVGGIRNLRAELGIQPGAQVPAVLIPPADREATLREHGDVIQLLARVNQLDVDAFASRPAKALYALVNQVEIYVPLEGLLDLEKEENRLQRELEEIDNALAATQGKLTNENFVGRAPANVVDKVRIRGEELQAKRDKLQEGVERIRTIRRH
jgi:valyl-tRNA synthetase